MTVQREILLLALTIFFSWIVITLATWFAWHNQDLSGTKIHDVFFKILPDYSDVTTPIPNYIGIIATVVALIGLKDKHWGYACQYVLFICALLLIRSFTTTLTLLPNIHIYEYCKETPTSFFEVVQKQIEHGSCGDYMFSGHTATVFLLYMMTHRHKWDYTFELISGLLVGVMIIALLLLRWHYSFDIVVAIVIVYFVFKYYKDYECEDYWFYFPSMKQLNIRCERVKQTPSVEPTIPTYQQCPQQETTNLKF